jgi:hypothetical protein
MSTDKTLLLIFLSFASVHSITVSRWFKNFCRRLFGAIFLRVWYRFLYTCVSAITAAAAFACIHRVPDELIWLGPVWLRWSLHALQFAALTFGVLAFEHLDGGEFLGLKQVWRYLIRGEAAGNDEGLSERGLVTVGVYGIVRHPMYLAGILIFTFEPDLTRNGILITVLADVYFVFGVFIEERRFLEIFGDQYRQYVKRVPRLNPF